MSTCVYCNSAENLNTDLTITIDDGSRVVVQICDTHAEDATVKTARQAYLSKQAEIQKVMEQAKALGLTIGQSSSGLTIAQAPPTAAPKQMIAKPAAMRVQRAEGDMSGEFDENDPSVVDTDQLKTRNTSTKGGSLGQLGHAESYAMLNPASGKDKLNPEMLKGKAKLGIVEGRGGQQLIIPRKRVDKTGTTIVNIKKNEDDHKLQARFKQLAADSIKDNVDMARNGYQDTTRTCTICNGDCVINGQDCPKCHGAGIISVY